ncbi:MAG: cation transporter [Litorimonas sp.]
MTEDCGCSADTELAFKSSAYRRALWVLIGLNLSYAIVEFVGGWLTGSQALKADALDFLGDGLISLLALIALSWPAAWRARTALFQGIFLGGLGAWVVVTTLLKVWNPTPIESLSMGVFALGALIVNLIAVIPLIPFKDGDANMRAIWLFSRNDAIGNIAVIFAAGLVWLTTYSWPDYLVAMAIGALFLHSAYLIVNDANRELRS